MPPPLHGNGVTFGWHDWPWVAALVVVVGLFWLALRLLQRRARR